MYTLDLVSGTGNISYKSYLISGVMSSCLRLRVVTQFDHSSWMFHNIQSSVSTATSSSLYQILKWTILGSIHNKPCPSLETIERIESLM